MLTTSGAFSTKAESGPRRRTFAQSRASTTRSAASSGSVAAQPSEVHEGVLARERNRPGQVEEAVLAELLEGEPHGEDGAESVAVGVLVGGDQKPVV